MKPAAVIWIIVAVLAVCCLYTHRRVIRALVKHEPMPKAPKWHFWVPKKGRRS